MKPEPNRNATGAPSGETVPLAVAAQRLGISYDAARHRIKSGTLRAEKRGGRWFASVSEPEASGGLSGGEPERSGSKPEADLLDRLRDEVAFLRNQLAERSDELRRRDEEVQRRDEEVRRVHMLLAAALERPLAINAESQASTRVDVPQERNPASSRGDVAAEPPRDLTLRESAVRRWWRRLTGEQR